MNQVVRTSMRDQVYNIIKGRILSQEYNLGDPINIVSLSKELAISNTPIREAVSMLCAEGLIASNINSKFRVVELNEKMMWELNETAYTILSGAYASCIREKRENTLAALLKAAFAIQENAFTEEENKNYIQKAMAFDRCFVEITENTKLLSIYDSLSDLLFLSIRYAYQNTQMARSQNLDEHRALMDAVEAHNHSEVQALLFHHYDKHFYETR